jgi:hypothetical protein
LKGNSSSSHCPEHHFAAEAPISRTEFHALAWRVANEKAPDCLIELAVVSETKWNKGDDMSLGTILLIILVLLVIGALPTWGYSSAWGPAPAGLLGVVLIVVLILVLLGRI